MRHKKKFNHLSRTSAHRKAMLSNMASSLIIHKRIRTTLAKAKALRMYVEPLITRSKEDTTHQRRMVFRKLQDKVAVAELFREVSVKVADRPGGYTRIIKLGNRLGDNAEMCMIELVDFNENLLGLDKKAPAKAKSTRRRGGAKKSAASATTAAKPVTTDAKPEGEPAGDSKPETTESVQTETAEKPEMQVEEAVATKDQVEEIAEPVVEDVKDEAAEPEAEVEAKDEAKTKKEESVEDKTESAEKNADQSEKDK